MTDHRDELAFHDRENRVWADPARGLDYSMKRMQRLLDRLRREEAARALTELRAKGMTFSVRGGRLFAGPPEACVNGTAQRIEQLKEFLVQLVQQEAA